MTRVAVIGLGYFAQFHIAAWAARAKITCLMDRDAAVVAAAAKAHDLPATTEITDLLATDPEIIDIVAPPPAHAALIRATLAEGRTIICQKPFCASLAEAEAITREAEAAGTTLLIHENFRFQPWHREIKALLDAGTLGTIWQARFALRPGDGRGPEAYLARQPAFRAMPRLLIHETGVHFIDLFRWFFGEIESVYAELRRLNPAIAAEDAGILMMSHTGGARTTFDGNRLADHSAENMRHTMGEMLIEGEGGSLALDGAGRLWHRAFGKIDAVECPVNAPVDPHSFGGGCVAALINHVLDGGPLENRAAAYLPVIRATDAAYRSAQTGQRISLV